MQDIHDQKTEQWFEDDNFWRECYPYLFPDGHFEAASREAEQIIRLLNLTRGEVLDLCCGPGRHAVALAQRGFEVSAVDRSPFLLQKASKAATEANVELELILEDMRRYIQPARFECVINVYSSFGYFDDARDDLIVLRNIYQSLKPGGTCLIDMASQRWLQHYVDPVYMVEEPDGTRFTQYQSILECGSLQRLDWILEKDGQQRNFTFFIRIFSGQQLSDLMLQAGFARVELFGKLDGSPYHSKADRLVAVGYK